MKIKENGDRISIPVKKRLNPGKNQEKIKLIYGLSYPKDY